VIHVHNLFPLLTASVPWAAVRAGVPVVWTCRNRRVVCVEGTHYRDGAPCHLCRPGWRVPGVRHGCYQRLAVARGVVSPASSTVASGLVTVSTSAFAAIARRHVLAVGITDSVARWLVESAGFAPERVRVKFNGIPGPPADPATSPAADSDVFLFAGQLADYKGLPILLDAWQRTTARHARLRIVGDCMCAPEVEAAAAADPRITFVGPVPPDAMPAELAGARVVVAPSTTPETFGRVAAEALAYGRPVITSGLGGLGEIVDDASGWTTGTNPAAMAGAIDEAARADDLVAVKGAAGRARHAAMFSPEATTAALVDIYREAVDRGGQAGDRAG
jgi:glycosyltransferase involved in cell wall biosynthesis